MSSLAPIDAPIDSGTQQTSQAAVEERATEGPVVPTIVVCGPSASTRATDAGPVAIPMRRFKSDNSSDHHHTGESKRTDR